MPFNLGKGMLNPAEDGITHINIYSKGRISLGRGLSNFAHTPFTHPRDGRFASIEAYWYWLSTGSQYGVLRPLHGYAAKTEGRKYPKVPVNDFEYQIEWAIYEKLWQTPALNTALANSTLPFTHYYCYGETKVVMPPNLEWLLQIFEEARIQARFSLM